jgi:RND superfamily putative drug exporter
MVVIAIFVAQAVPADTEIEENAPGESGEAFDLFKERFREEEQAPQEVIVFQHPSLKVDDPEYRETVAGLMQDLRELRVAATEQLSSVAVLTSTRVVTDTTTHYDTGLPREQSPFVATREGGGDVTFALVDLENDFGDAAESVSHVLDTVAAAQEEHPDFEILEGGTASQDKQQEDIISEDFSRALLLNLPITLGLLILAFGAVVTALVPLALALSAIFIANGILALISQAYPLADAYSEITLLMGLATGIDYALFVISRYRTERRAGRSKEEALETASSTSGKAVVFAGLTVILAICGMFLVRNPIFSSIAIAAIVVVALAVVASVTLLPALIAMLGDNLDRLRVPFLGRGEARHGGVWGVISDHVLARPVLLATSTFVVLLVLSIPLLTLNLGFNGAKGLSDDVEAKRALLALEENFTLGLTEPTIVVVDAGEAQSVFAPQVQSHVGQLTGLVEAETVSPQNREAPYGEPIQTEINDAGDTELIEIPLNADVGEKRAIDAVNHLRDDLIPGSFEDSSADPLVTGSTAFNIDFRDDIIFRTPFVLAFVLTLVFIVMLVVFRSLVIAAKAIVLNLLSVGAAYGILVLVFQEGWLLQGVLGFEATGIIESWLPLFLFSIIFGLSMDYHMFIMGRIKEAHERGLPNDEAISVGVKATAATITNAAAIMVAVALIFAFTRYIGLKQFGFGLAIAVLIDATIIRSILLPASMKLLGERNWYLPQWLEWLPHVRMAE